MMRVWRLSVWRLSRTSGLSREQRGLGRLKLAQRLPTSRVTRTPRSRSKGQRSRSPGHFGWLFKSGFKGGPSRQGGGMEWEGWGRVSNWIWSLLVKRYNHKRGDPPEKKSASRFDLQGHSRSSKGYGSTGYLWLPISDPYLTAGLSRAVSEMKTYSDFCRKSAIFFISLCARGWAKN